MKSIFILFLFILSLQTKANDLFFEAKHSIDSSRDITVTKESAKDEAFTGNQYGLRLGFFSGLWVMYIEFNPEVEFKSKDKEGEISEKSILFNAEYAISLSPRYIFSLGAFVGKTTLSFLREADGSALDQKLSVEGTTYGGVFSYRYRVVGQMHFGFEYRRQQNEIEAKFSESIKKVALRSNDQVNFFVGYTF